MLGFAPIAGTPIAGLWDFSVRTLRGGRGMAGGLYQRQSGGPGGAAERGGMAGGVCQRQSFGPGGAAPRGDMAGGVFQPPLAGTGGNT